VAYFRVEKLVKKFGGLTAVNEVTFDVEKGEIFGLIGPNGSGKTTTFNMISGVYPPTSGKVVYGDREIQGMKSHRICHLGVGRTFQVVKPLGRMTVLDNVLVARPRQAGEHLWHTVLRPLATDRETARNRQVALDILEFVGLRPRALELAENLSYAEEKLLALARMLAMEAELLLLDEPASGLDPHSVAKLFGIIRDLVERGKTVCIIEHNLDVIKDLTHRVIYLDEGRAFAEGTPDAVMSNPELAERYFGV